MVNYLIVLFAITLVYFASAERLIIYTRLIGLQGLLLCGIALIELKEVNTANLIFIASESLVFKALLIPYLLVRIINRSGVSKVHHQAMPGFYLLILSIFALLISVILANSLINPFINTIYMAIALFTLFPGFYIAFRLNPLNLFKQFSEKRSNLVIIIYFNKCLAFTGQKFNNIFSFPLIIYPVGNG